VDRLADRVETLQALRHYADFLGLPGDRYALLLIDLWPSASVNRSLAEALSATSATLRRPVRRVTRRPGPSRCSTHRPRPSPPSLSTASSSPRLRWRRVAGPSQHRAGPLSPAGHRRDTGGEPPHQDAPRRRGQFVLRLAVWTLGILVVLGAAGLAADHWRPHWLTSLHIPVSTPPATRRHRPPRARTPRAPLPRSTAWPPRHRRRSPSRYAHPRSPSWSPLRRPELGGGDRARPLRAIFAATMPAGAVQKFPVTTGLTLQIGSASGRTLVTVDNKVVGFYFRRPPPPPSPT